MENSILLSDQSPEQEWDENNKDRNVFAMKSCHWGQLKLFYTEFEFLTICSNEYDLKDCVVVYVGSADGAHITLLSTLFSDVKFILYDPREFIVKENDKIEIHTKDDGFFTDETVKKVLNNPKVKNKNILFISDIRLTEDDESANEKQIIDDMIKQQKWGILLNSVKMMFKFRLPYVYPKGHKLYHHIYKYDTNDINEKINLPDDFSKEQQYNTFLYLKGNVYWQLYAPIFSTETRLICGKGKNGKYDFIYYNYKKYENQCFYHNLVERKKEIVYKQSDDIKNHIVFPSKHNLEISTEYYLVEQYLKIIKHIDPSHENIIKTLHEIHYNMFLLTHKTLLTCSLFTIKQYCNTYDKFEKIMRTKPKTKNEINNLLDDEYNLIKNTIKEQLNTFSNNNTILSKSENKKEIDKLNFEQKNLSVIYKHLQKYIKIYFNK